MRTLQSAWREILQDRDLQSYLASLPWRPRLWGFLRRPGADHGRPPYLAGAPKDIRSSLRNPLPLLRWGTGTSPSRPSRIALASRSLHLPDDSALPWTVRLEDYEDQAALHRFAWLLPEVLLWSRSGVDRDAAWELFLAMARDWTAANPVPTDSPAWHPYTVAERLVNWTLTALALGRQLRVDEPALWISIRDQGEHLRRNLEYQGEKLTGNHLSNNGRALYLCGLAHGNEVWAAEGRAILIHELERLFPEPRFLREGSSHYHFLVTRNYCEALWAAKASGDRAAEEQLTPAVARMAQGCRFFLVQEPSGSWRIPLIGDISPDCPPEWLIGVPWVAAALSGTEAPSADPPEKGWHEFFPRTPGGPPAALKDLGPSSTWARADASEWTLFAHVNPDGYPLCPGHAHQDTGAFVAYYHGCEIVIDAGRRSYSDDDAGSWGRSCWAHSLLSVDRQDPGPYWRRIYPEDLIERMAGRRPRIEVREDGISITHGGFSRIPEVGAYTRELSITAEGELAIADEVGGSGTHRIDLSFHFAGKAVQNGGEVVIEGTGWKARLVLPPELRQIAVANAPKDSEGLGWRTLRYGGKTPAGAVVAGAELSLPWRGKTVLRMER